MTARVCKWPPCGVSIDHLRADAEYCGSEHRRLAWRADEAKLDKLREQLYLLGNVDRDACHCNGSHALEHDAEGDPRCAMCGKPRPWDPAGPSTVPDPEAEAVLNETAGKATPEPTDNLVWKVEQLSDGKQDAIRDLLLSRGVTAESATEADIREALEGMRS